MTETVGADGSSGPGLTAAVRLFGDRLPIAERYVDLLRRGGVERGLIGPKEIDRLWDRHVLNSAVVADLIPHGARVVDVGSGAGLPGVPLLIARPDLRMTLLDSMARRVAWLHEVVDGLSLTAVVTRGRAEDRQVRRALGGVDVVACRAVAPLGKLAGWCMPLLRQGGSLLALKGESAAAELDRDGAIVEAAGGGERYVTSCGHDFLDTPTTVIVVRKNRSANERDSGPRSRKDQCRASRVADRSDECST